MSAWNDKGHGNRNTNRHMQPQFIDMEQGSHTQGHVGLQARDVQ